MCCHCTLNVELITEEIQLFVLFVVVMFFFFLLWKNGLHKWVARTHARLVFSESTEWNDEIKTESEIANEKESQKCGQHQIFLLYLFFCPQITITSNLRKKVIFFLKFWNFLLYTRISYSCIIQFCGCDQDLYVYMSTSFIDEKCNNIIFQCSSTKSTNIEWPLWSRASADMHMCDAVNLFQLDLEMLFFLLSRVRWKKDRQSKTKSEWHVAIRTTPIYSHSIAIYL